MHKVQRKKEIIPVSLENERRGDDPYIIWTERGLEKIPFVRFHAKAAVTRDKAARKVGETYNLRFKLGRFASPLLRDILFAHGFQEALGNSKDYNLLWMGPKLNPAICKNLASFQKVNRFPNTRELGRKDSLCKNIRALRLITRSHRFDFMPKSYLLPKEYEGLRQAFQKRPGQLWIKKPVASACGCGIKVIDSMKEVRKGETAVVSSYISNPLLINGYKFDLRLYVLVTSYSPLVIYLYQDGLTRFATEKYQPTGDSLRNKFMHLTNTSVNKKSSKYVNSDDQEVEDHGNLWSLSALLRYLKESGKDTAFLLRKIEDIIIKTIISAEKSHVAPPESYPPHKNNSFELYGFDILIDDTLKPWLLEVNESPALSYDNPMSFKIKTHLLVDTLTLVGVECQNPRRAKEPTEIKSKDMTPYMKRLEENKKILQRIKEEEQRQGGYVRIFPKNETWYSYCPLLRRKDHTEVLYMRLFQDVEDAVENQHMEQFERKLPPLLKDTRASPGQKTHQMGKTMPPLSKTNSGTPRQQDPKPAPLQRSTSSPQPLLPLRKQAPIRIPAKDPVRALAEKLRKEKYQNQVMRPQIQEDGKSGKLTPLQNDGVQYGGMTRRPLTSTAMLHGREGKTMQGSRKPVIVLERDVGKDLGSKRAIGPSRLEPCIARTGGQRKPAITACLRPLKAK